MLNRIILSQILLLYLFNLNAQEKSPIKLKLETGFLWDAIDGKIYFSGALLNIETKIKISKYSVIGLRIGGAVNTQRILNADPDQFYIENGAGQNSVISLGPTFDYYFNTSNLRPYLGFGLTHSFLTTSKRGFLIANPLDALDLNIGKKIGFLVRAGFDLRKAVIGKVDFSKFILGLEFNYIPKSDVTISNGQKLGTVATSNFSLSIGHIIGEMKS